MAFESDSSQTYLNGPRLNLVCANSLGVMKNRRKAIKE